MILKGFSILWQGLRMTKTKQDSVPRTSILKVSSHLKIKRENHSKTGSEDKEEIKCRSCGKILYDKGSLKRHMQHHTGNFRHICHICQQGFSQNKYLKDHIRMHEGKYYTCEYCIKRFSNIDGFKRHLPEHTGKYPFHCVTCNQGFNYKAKLEKHEKQH